MNQIEQTPNGKDYFEPMHSAEHLINGAIARTLPVKSRNHFFHFPDTHLPMERIC